MKIFDDPTPNGLICGRLLKHGAWLLGGIDISEEEREDLFTVLMGVGRKLAMVWTHYDRYVKEEDMIVKDMHGRLQQGREPHVEVAQKLWFEFDGFLVQVKSCLDQLVKLPTPILGAKRWHPSTFSGRGEGVAKALRGSAPKKHKKLAEEIATWIEGHVPAWLGPTIEARDRANHCLRPWIDERTFTVVVVTVGGKQMVSPPRFTATQTMREFLTTVWENLFCFCEAFLWHFARFRMHSALRLRHTPVPATSERSPWSLELDPMDFEDFEAAWEHLRKHAPLRLETSGRTPFTVQVSDTSIAYKSERDQERRQSKKNFEVYFRIWFHEGRRARSYFPNFGKKRSPSARFRYFSAVFRYLETPL